MAQPSIVSSVSCTDGVTTGFTVGSQSGKLLLYCILYRPDAMSAPTSISWNGNAFTKLYTGTAVPSQTERMDIWYLLNPSAATGDITTSFGSSAYVIAHLMLVQDADNSSEANAFNSTPTSSTGSGTSGSHTPTSATGEFVVTACARVSQTGTNTTGSPATQILDSDNGDQANLITSYRDGDASATVTVTFDGSSRDYSMTGVSIKGVSGTMLRGVPRPGFFG